MVHLGDGHNVFERGFYRDDGLDFQVRGALGRAVHGASEVGEVLATVSRISGRRDWVAGWSATAERVERAADDARRSGRLATASSGYLRAATYWACAVDGLTTESDSPILATTFGAHRRCWDAVVSCSQDRFQPLAVPYENTTLPGFLLRPDASGTRRPTLVITNGSDGAVSDLWSPAAAGALTRGWNAFVYDGPGQQSMLFDRHTTFRPDWEAVLSPVLDALVARDEVDSARLFGYGVSQGGYWLPRALAFEHRLRAAVLDPGVVDVSASWTRPLNKSMREQLSRRDREGFTKNMRVAARLPAIRRVLTGRARPYGISDWYDLYVEVERYRLDTETAGHIRTPLLITDPEHEQFWPGQSTQLAALVPGADLVAFTAAEGAGSHCQPMGRLLTEQRMFDWLEEFT